MYLESRNFIYQEFEDLISSSRYSENKELIMKAFNYCIKFHNGQFRKTGEEYFTHPVAVAKELLFSNFDYICIISALLHDTIEDTIITKEFIEKEFSLEVAEIVDGVSKFKLILNLSKEQRDYQDLKKFFLASIKDIRVLIVKLFDRLHNMRTIGGHNNLEKQKKKAIETLDVFVPLAERIGIQKVKIELEDLCFQVLNSQDRLETIEKINEIMVDNANVIINQMQENLKTLLRENSLNAEINWRYKSVYSIWQKMQIKNVQIRNITDIIGFRIIAESIEDCYYILYLIHQKYQFVKGKFNDYISSPKENGYKSLHTVVLMDIGQMIEIQIRTKKMHEEAEYGIASHLEYKKECRLNKLQEKDYQCSWIDDILYFIEDSNINSIKNTIKANLISIYYLEDNLFKISLIQENSTVFDAALILDVNKAVYIDKILINNQYVPLSTILKDGDIMELKIKNEITISSLWEKFCNIDLSKTILKGLLKI